MPYIKKKTSIIQRDHLGIFVIGANLVARPRYGTVFNVGDEVKAHYMLNNMRVGPHDQESISKNDSIYEIWYATVISAHVYKNRIINDNAFIYKNKGIEYTFNDYLDYVESESLKYNQWITQHTGFNNIMAPLIRKHIRSQRLEKFLGNEETSL